MVVDAGCLPPPPPPLEPAIPGAIFCADLEKFRAELFAEETCAITGCSCALCGVWMPLPISAFLPLEEWGLVGSRSWCLELQLGGSEPTADHPGNMDSNARLASSSLPSVDSFWFQKLDSLGLIVDEIVELSTCIVCSAESSDQGTDLAPHRPDSATVGGEGFAMPPLIDEESRSSAYYTDALTGECKQQ